MCCRPSSTSDSAFLRLVKVTGVARCEKREYLRFDSGSCLDEVVDCVIPVSRECECFGGFLFESA
jgi:hypothetical protein